MISMLMRYKAWATERVFEAVRGLPEEEIYRHRRTHFKSIAHTLNHVYVIDRIFQGHLTGQAHGFTARNTKETPRIETLWQDVLALDAWYIDYFDQLSEDALAKTVHFKFVDGGDGAMTRGEIAFHLANHASYHRGFVGDMLNQCGVTPKATDLPVYLRDAHNK